MSRKRKPEEGKIINKIDSKVNKKKPVFSFNYIVLILIFSFLLSLIIGFTSLAAERDLEKEQELGRKLAKDIEKQYEVVKDLAQNSLLQKIGNKLAAVSDLEGMTYHFKILNKEGVNAFSLPGGYIYVTADLLDYIQSDDELAGVLAHEMAHIIHNHALKQTEDNTKYSLMTILAVLLTREPDVAVLGKLTTITFLNQYSREYEEEADLTALELLMKAGYNPGGLLTFLERLYTQESFKPEVNWGIFQTHPATGDRVNYIRDKLIEKGMDIDRRVITDYLKVSTKYIYEGPLCTGIIYIDETPVLNLSFSGNEDIYLLKISEAAQNLDQYLSTDLAPYEIRVLTEGVASSLLIRNNAVISLEDSETIGLNKSSSEVLKESKEKIEEALWRFKLLFPFY